MFMCEIPVGQTLVFGLAGFVDGLVVDVGLSGFLLRFVNMRAFSALNFCMNVKEEVEREEDCTAYQIFIYLHNFILLRKGGIYF